MNAHSPLKLLARDAEDIQVVSATLQDALVPIHDMAFDAQKNEFMMAVSRFCWEKHNPEGQHLFQPCERVHCAVRVSGIQVVKTQQIDLSKRADILELLALVTDAQGLQLVFAGGPKLRLEGQGWSLKLEDFGEPWPAAKTPCHE